MTPSVVLHQIGTSRLTIRPLTGEDLPNVYSLLSDYETACKAGYRPIVSSSEAEGYLRESIRLGTAYGLTLKDRPSDVFGILTLDPQEREDGGGVKTRTAEIGYFMRSDMRRNGYMSEAVDAIMAYLLTTTPTDRVLIRVIAGNEASRRVALKCGFLYEGLLKEAGENGATGETESLELYSLTRQDYLSGKGGPGGNLSIDIVTPGRVLSEGCPGIPRLHPFYEGDRCGLKDEEGQVVFATEWDTISQWEDADVVYARRGGEHLYFNTAGERILREVPLLEGADPAAMPYYVSEEQGRPDMMTFTLGGGPEDPSCCFLKGRWVRLGRILRSGAKAYLGSGDILPFSRDAFDAFLSPFTYIYAAFEASAEGSNNIDGCIDSLRLMGCYDSSWQYLTSVWVSPSAGHIACHPAAVLAPFERYLSHGDLRRISVGTDPLLPDGAVRIRQVRYFKDRWPLPEELQYRDSVIDGTCEEMTRLRALALSAIREKSRPELRSAALRDFTQGCTLPGGLYRSKDWDDTVRKMRQLLSFGYDPEDAIWRLSYALAEGLGSGKGAFDFGCAERLVRWLAAEGAGVNCVRELSTPLDVLLRVREALLHVEAAPVTLSSLDEVIAAVKECGGKQVQGLCSEKGDDIEGVLGVLYPWIKRTNK